MHHSEDFVKHLFRMNRISRTKLPLPNITFINIKSSGANLGGAGGGRFLFLQGFDPLPTQTILRFLILVTDPKIFLKAPLAPIYINFEGGGEAPAEKTRFFGQNFPKIAQKKRLFRPFVF